MGTTTNVQAWSITPASNANSDTAINAATGMDPSNVEPDFRAIMASVARFSDDTGGGLTAGGTANALTVTTNQALSAGQLAAGLRIVIKAASQNSSATVTFAPDSLTAQAIKRCDGSALAVGSIQAGMFLDLVYNTGTSEWWAANISPAQFLNTVVTLTDGASVALNAALGQTFRLTTTTNPTIAVPSNPVDGQTIIIEIAASGGARTPSLAGGAGGFIFGTDITALTAVTSGKTDYIQAKYNLAANKWRVVGYVRGF